MNAVSSSQRRKGPLCVVAGAVLLLNAGVYWAMLPGRAASRPEAPPHDSEAAPSDLAAATWITENPREAPPEFIDWRDFEAVDGDAVRVRDDFPPRLRELEGQRVHAVGAFFKIKRATTESTITQGIVMPVRFKSCCGGGSTCTTKVEATLYVDFAGHALPRDQGSGIVDVVGTLELLKADALGCIYALTDARVFPRPD